MTDPNQQFSSQWTPPPPQYGYGYPVVRPTNGLAIAGMVCAIIALPAACFTWGVGGIVLGVLGAIFGHVARRKIRQRDEQGGGMALTGVILGWISVALSIVFLVFMILFVIYGETWVTNLENSGGSDWDDALRGMLMGWLPLKTH